MNRSITVFFLSALVVASGCGSQQGSGALGTATANQIDPLNVAYGLLQSRVLKASAWAGLDPAGAPVEYWAAKPSYSSGAARTFSPSTQSCAAWKSSVCTSSWSGATYYKAVYTQTTLNCSFPQDPC